MATPFYTSTMLLASCQALSHGAGLADGVRSGSRSKEKPSQLFLFGFDWWAPTVPSSREGKLLGRTCAGKSVAASDPNFRAQLVEEKVLTKKSQSELTIADTWREVHSCLENALRIH